MSKCLPAVLCAILLSCLFSFAKENNDSPEPWTIEYISVAWKPEQDFKRISEYFTGKENTSGRLILRSDAEYRAGQYWTLTLNRSAAEIPVGSRFIVDYIVASESKEQHQVFPVGQTADTNCEVLLGLTGSAWQEEQPDLLAWQVTLESPDGSVLAAHHSFLWKITQQEIQEMRETLPNTK